MNSLTPDGFAAVIRRRLRAGGSAGRARIVQGFFKEPVQAYGWRTADLRKMAPQLRREITAAGGPGLLLAVAEKLFASPAVEEAALGVILIEREVRNFGEVEFRRLARWIAHIRNWAACDGLCIGLLGPMVKQDPRRLAALRTWAGSKSQWSRRAAVVALVPAARRGFHAREVFELCDGLLADERDLVRKGVGWLLKELSRERPGEVRAYLDRVRERISPLTARIAREKL